MHQIAGLVQAAEQSMTVPEKILATMGSFRRKIAISVANETPYTWEGLNVYFDSGTSDTVIPEFVKTNETLLYNARKTKQPWPTGSVGVICYYMKDVKKTLAVLFDVPFDYNLFHNFWNAEVYPGRVRADYGMYDDLLCGDRFRGDDGWHTKVIGEGFKVKGIMSSSGSCTLELKISQL